MKPVLWGLALGLGGAVVIARFLESLLYNVTATDPATYLGVALLLATTVLAAAFVPTLGATKIDPVEALRTEH
jgi:putative ABC transport system permease protein